MPLPGKPPCVTLTSITGFAGKGKGKCQKMRWPGWGGQHVGYEVVVSLVLTRTVEGEVWMLPYLVNQLIQQGNYHFSG